MSNTPFTRVGMTPAFPVFRAAEVLAINPQGVGFGDVGAAPVAANRVD